MGPIFLWLRLTDINCQRKPFFMSIFNILLTMFCFAHRGFCCPANGWYVSQDGTACKLAVCHVVLHWLSHWHLCWSTRRRTVLDLCYCCWGVPIRSIGWHGKRLPFTSVIFYSGGQGLVWLHLWISCTTGVCNRDLGIFWCNISQFCCESGCIKRVHWFYLGGWGGQFTLISFFFFLCHTRCYFVEDKIMFELWYKLHLQI